MPAENPDEDQPQHQPELKDQQPQAPQEPEAARAIPALIDAYRKEQEKNRRQEASEDFWRQCREWATLAFVVATTAGVFTQAWFLRTTDEAIHISASAAKTAADAATNAVNVNIATERARLFVIGMTIKRSNEKDPNPTIAFQIANLGRTSALITQVSAECTIVDPPGRGTIPIYNAQRFQYAMSVITGGSTLSIPGSDCKLDKPITDEEFVALSSNKKKILFKGFVRFQDVFGEKFTQRFGYYAYDDKVDAFYALVGADAYSAEIKDQDATGPLAK
jgi:hypothetical protein